MFTFASMAIEPVQTEISRSQDAHPRRCHNRLAKALLALKMTKTFLSSLRESLWLRILSLRSRVCEKNSKFSRLSSMFSSFLPLFLSSPPLLSSSLHLFLSSLHLFLSSLPLLSSLQLFLSSLHLFLSSLSLLSSPLLFLSSLDNLPPLLHKSHSSSNSDKLSYRRNILPYVRSQAKTCHPFLALPTTLALGTPHRLHPTPREATRASSLHRKNIFPGKSFNISWVVDRLLPPSILQSSFKVYTFHFAMFSDALMECIACGILGNVSKSQHGRALALVESTVHPKDGES
jgi:hypothetical protein